MIPLTVVPAKTLALIHCEGLLPDNFQHPDFCLSKVDTCDVRACIVSFILFFFIIIIVIYFVLIYM